MQQWRGRWRRGRGRRRRQCLRQGRGQRRWSWSCRGAHPLRVEELRLVDRGVALRDHHEHVVAGHGVRQARVGASGGGVTHRLPIDPGQRLAHCSRGLRAELGAWLVWLSPLHAGLCGVGAVRQALVHLRKQSEVKTAKVTLHDICR